MLDACNPCNTNGTDVGGNELNVIGGGDRMDKIIYTHTDEAPMLATYSLLPIIQRFAKPIGISIETRDISLSGRILAQFKHKLTAEQQATIEDELTYLGKFCQTPVANVIKLPNISASIPQLLEAIKELQGQGFAVPDYPATPANDDEQGILDGYKKVIGSAVNPVLREGNSDRRAAPPIKAYAQKNPHPMGAWESDCKSYVAHMESGDFFENEKSVLSEEAGDLEISFVGEDGNAQSLRTFPVEKNEVVDSTFMDAEKLQAYLEKEIQDSFDKGLMISLHLKATMMKVSDPILFGHAVKVFFKDVFTKHADLFAELKVNANNGFQDLLNKIKGHAKETEILADIEEQYKTRPRLAMVDSNKGITNLHVPSDIIIDASMPCVVRDSGRMWNKDNKLEDVKCLIPDRCYATFYKEMLDDCRKNGQFDVKTVGNVPNVGLMAKKAEEYGSHPNTFEMSGKGTVKVTRKRDGKVLMEQNVNKGDIFRACTVKEAPIRDWVKLAVTRARAVKTKAVFWLDPARAHDRIMIDLAKKFLKEDHNDGDGLDIEFLTPLEATALSCKRARAGEDTISVTGNVLRDYLTDMFPIIELGTSAKVLSIVPLLGGGFLLETGAGGSAPKHVQQFVEENHLRWDSLGEYQALATAFQELGSKENDERAILLGDTLMDAVGQFLENKKSPSRKVNELDNRGSNFYIALYWAQAIAKKNKAFEQLALDLTVNEQAIVQELIDCQGKPVDLGGYYRPDVAKVTAAMQPSKTLNSFINTTA